MPDNTWVIAWENFGRIERYNSSRSAAYRECAEPNATSGRASATRLSNAGMLDV